MNEYLQDNLKQACGVNVELDANRGLPALADDRYGSSSAVARRPQ